jgi:hypothetical protein
MDPELSITGAEERAARLGATLKDRGFERVVVLTGGEASRAAIRTALDSAVAAIEPGGTLVFVFEGHGVGGDYGDARLLSADEAPDGEGATGLDVERLPSTLLSQDPTKRIVVLTDAVHSGTANGSALIGPVAQDWVAPGERFGSISATNSGLGSTPGVFQGALQDGLEGGADVDGNGHISLGELMGFLQGAVSTQSSGRMHPMRSGGLGDEMVLSTLVTAPEVSVALVAPTPRVAGHYRKLGTRVGIAGGVVGATSLAMYAIKRSDCVQDAQGLNCGDSAGYATYQRLQNISGWTAGALLATGAGLWLLNSGPVALGPGTVQLSGQF